MADHLIGKFWGLSGALLTALVTLALLVPTGAEAAGPGSGALSQLSAVVPASAQRAVSGALSQVPSASGAVGAAVTVPDSTPSAPVVVPPPPPPMPVVARPAPQPAPANPVPAVPVPMPAPAVEARPTVSVPTQSVAQPEAIVQAAQTGSNLSSTIRPDSAVGERPPARRTGHPRAHHHAGTAWSATPASRRQAPIARTTATHMWSPVPALETTSRGGAQPAAPARRADSRAKAGHARHLAPPRFRPRAAITTAPPVALPLTSALPPSGGEGSAAGAGGAAAGAAAAALLAIVGVCILRALLPGLLGLGLTPVQSALLVSRLERPG
jgi:hypothetical protein